MRSINEVTILGHLGADIELRATTTTGKAVTSMSVATNESWLDQQGQQVTRTDWHRIVLWGTLALSCATYLKKGSRCLVKGRLQTRNYDDAAGVTRYVTEVIANEVIFLDRAPVAEDAPAVEAEPEPTPEPVAKQSRRRKGAEPTPSF